MGFIIKRPIGSVKKTPSKVISISQPRVEESIQLENKSLDKGKYIIVTTDNEYFRWQMLVQINNFKKLKLLNELIFVVSIENTKSTELKNIEKETGVKIYCYRDERVDKTYISSVRYHILKKFILENPQYGKCFFLLDPDVLLIERLSLTNEMINNDVWYLSNTRSYIYSPYIKSKSEILFNEMCQIVGIAPELVIKNDNHAGGAQYLLKNVDSAFFEKVELDSVKLYRHMIDTSSKYNPSHPIQAWTADMWSILWNAWKFGHSTEIIDELDFCWATDPITSWKKTKIFHNAGVFSQDYLFNKCHFTKKAPFNEDFDYVKEEFCSRMYVEEILSTKKNYSQLINKI